MQISNEVEYTKTGRLILPKEVYALAAQNGISRHTLQQRVNIGWTVERSATEPLKPRQKYSSEWRAIARRNGITDERFWQRINRLGWSEEKAATQTVETSRADQYEVQRTKIISREEMARAEQNGIARANVLYRLKAGWSREEAVTVPLIPEGKRKDYGMRRKTK